MEVVSIDDIPAPRDSVSIRAFCPDCPASFRARLVKETAPNIFVEFTSKRFIKFFIKWHSRREKLDEKSAAI